MVKSLLRKPKKVEYIELVYDLIFVYLVQRCIDVLEPDGGAFITGDNYLDYVYSTLIIVQIWAFSTIYINRYGKNGLSEYIFLILNMYLLCFLAVNTQENWRSVFVPYQIVWGLVTLNLLIQYARQLKRPHITDPERQFLKRRIVGLGVQTGIILLCIPLLLYCNVSVVWLALIAGFVFPIITWKSDQCVPTNIAHLAERAMLFIVFSFGETLVSAAEYFERTPSAGSVYLSACAFLAVIGMLIAYGYVYDKRLDHARLGAGTWFMYLHIPIILSINNVTICFEHVRETETNTTVVLNLLIISFFAFYACLLILSHRAGKHYLPAKSTWLPFIIISAVYMVAMIICRENVGICAAICVLYPFAMFVAIYRHRADAPEDLSQQPEQDK